MKRLLSAVSTIALVFFFTPLAPSATAQMGQHHGQGRMMAQSDSVPGPGMGMMRGGMMQGGMMQMMRGMHQQMMQNPMHRSRMTAFMLPALADTLGLSDDQVAELKQLRSEAMAHRQDHREQMMAQRKQFMSLFEGEDQPSSEAVREHVTAMAEQRANRQAALYETTQQMRQVLTADQRQMLSSLTPQQRMRQMMSHMPMMDMMRMMKSMHQGRMGGMQGMPMMQDGNMRPGGMQMDRPQQKNRQNQ